jgi:hypothetical protein
MTFPFLSLPRELRQEIYIHHLAGSGPVILLDREDGDEYGTPALGVNLLRVCRQIHAEASKILYANNRFEIWPHATRTTHKFLTCLSPANAAALQDVQIVLKLRVFEHIDYVWQRYPGPLEALDSFVIALAVVKRPDDYEDDDDLPDGALYNDGDVSTPLYNGCEWLAEQLFGIEHPGIEWWGDDGGLACWDDCGNDDVRDALRHLFPETYRTGKSMYGKRKLEAERNSGLGGGAAAAGAE